MRTKHYGYYALRGALVAVLALIVLCVPAKAQLLLDNTMGTSVGGHAELDAAARAGANAAFVPERLKKMGYTDIHQSPSSPVQYSATTPEGMRVLLTVDPTTGQIISAIPE